MANKKFSWNAKTPMTSPDMVANPIKWNPMSEDWKKRVEAMQLYNEDATAPFLLRVRSNIPVALQGKQGNARNFRCHLCSNAV